MENNTLNINNTIRIPLELEWNPKEDITTYELAQCLPYLIRRNIMEYEIDMNEKYLRHFKITNHNK